ncbi:Zn(II)2Cys6 transcription factor [Aspergillus nomiae NRRL 13137]|uniref:Zn(II)2Cys6 transcription factor n=1 Tax=Aspergillus nomiae NRRL (strain ATCC 15546 / NRRL 13137 / CBS 260.88 / M93) TaxID=1509407 RepID=A0A0L1JHS5_ASPN3|nr:Zn(II)2Cys6 transcription factor [Aspergillus nomiae NRRL 13137]KNG91257.1 Zn(II)2Cys6 transcription factor [Aspergillus nomiae NRRL 13137]
MATEVPIQPRKLRRTANACVACRQSKIKCSGKEPCANCQRRAVKCRFVEGSNKITVTESYLQQLRRQAKAHQSPTGTKRSAGTAFGSVVEVDDVSEELAYPPREEPSLPPKTIDHARSIWTSPFTLPSRTIKNTYKNKRNWIWLAPTSVWSFTARLSVMLSEKLQLESPYTTPSQLDQDIYPLRWKQATAEGPPDISGLPSVDHALYLFDTVKFHLGVKYRFFDERTFLGHIHEFYYGDAAQKATESRLWFVQFLLVLAFGNAFLLQSRNAKDPPGSKFFVRAMALMPDHASLWKDSLLASETLALAGLYLYCIDHRESAHVYVGQAIRIAQLEGLHTELPEDELGAATVTRCRNLWWTLYIMDRHLSSSLGLPMTTQDSDITTLIDPPSSCPQRDVTLSLQVRLSHLLSSILTSIYKNEKTQLGTFLETTRSILHTMAGHAQEIESIIHMKNENSVDTMPKGTRHITLLYHQCVIVATRPLLLSVLKERLDKLDHGEEDWQNFLAPTKSLISTGIKSAAKTLQILTHEDSLLEVFLPFDLEFTYAAAIHLAMADTLFPHSTEGQNYSEEVHAILDEMIYKGNRLAAVRKGELAHLETLFKDLATRIERRGLQTLTLSSPTENEQPTPCDGEYQIGGSTVQTEPIDVSLVRDPSTSPDVLHHTTSDIEFLENIGISSYEFFTIVNQIGNSDNYSLLDPAQVW